MATNWLTDEAVEAEIARLQQSEFVKLARKELRLKYMRRQALYQLRNLDKRGKELAKVGITLENIQDRLSEEELEILSEMEE